MKTRQFSVVGILAACVLVGHGLAWAQCENSASFGSWVSCKRQEFADSEKQRERQIKAKISQKSNANQSDSPSLSSNTGSLVDQSSASDFLSFALNAAGLKSQSDEVDATSFSATVSAYAVYAAVKKHDPLDPAFYNQHRMWRKVSVTIGTEFPDEEGSASNQRATLFGAKYLIWGRRDASDPSHRAAWNNLQKANLEAARGNDKAEGEARRFVLQRLWGVKDEDVDKSEEQQRIDRMPLNDLLFELSKKGLLKDLEKLIMKDLGTELEYLQASQDLMSRIRKAPQLSLAYQSKLRKEDGPDEHRLQAILDYGVPMINNLNLTVNAAFDYIDNKTVGGDKRGGRFAAEGKYQIRDTTLTESKEPVTLSFAGEGKWMTDITPTYKAQFKLTIPIVNGLNLPLSVTWANRTELIRESDVQGRVGFTFDLAKLAAGFRSLAP